MTLHWLVGLATILVRTILPSHHLRSNILLLLLLLLQRLSQSHQESTIIPTAAFATISPAVTQSQVELYRPSHPSPVGVTLHRPLATTIPLPHDLALQALRRSRSCV